MIQIKTTLIVLSFSAIAYVAADQEDVKHAIVRRESLLAAEAIRNITIRTPEHRVEIANIATDFLNSLNVALYALTVAIPNSPQGPVKDHLDYDINLFRNIKHELQKAILGDAEQLKEKLATSLEKLNMAIGDRNPEFRLAENSFSANQLTREHDTVIFGIYKVKVRAQVFEKTLKELESEISNSFDSVLKTFGGSKLDDAVVEDELRRFLRNIVLVMDECVYRLENWIEINSKSSENVKVIRDASEGISDLYEKVIRAVDLNHSGIYLKKKVLEMYDIALKDVKSIIRVDYGNDIGIQELIRSSVLKPTVVGYILSDNIKALANASQAL